MHVRTLDLVVLLAYLAGIVALGLLLTRRTKTSGHYMSADRSLPGWAVGLSIFGSYISSISFLANPGKSYAGNWNAFVFSLTIPIAALIAVRFFVPMYRASGAVSAYEHLEKRFGGWARTYAVICYLLMQMARMGTIVYLLAIAVAPLLGADVVDVILVTALLMTIYTLMGGMEAVIWTGMVQSLVLLAGPVVCVIVLLMKMPEGAAQTVELAAAHDKFSLGATDLSFTAPTIWVMLLFGLCTHLQNFGVDQGYVQRDITARTDREARRSIWLATWMYLPVAAVFFFIGTALHSFYEAMPERLPAEIAGGKSDMVFPHFIVHELPAGLTGLVIASIFAAGMDSNLSSMATLTLCDIYKRYFRPQADDKESLRVLRFATLVWGVCGTVVALRMIEYKSVLDVWWDLAGAAGGGVLALFLLGLWAKRVDGRAAAIGACVGIPLAAWMFFSKTTAWPVEWKDWANPLHGSMTLVVGNVAIVAVALASSCVLPGRARLLPSRD